MSEVRRLLSGYHTWCCFGWCCWVWTCGILCLVSSRWKTQNFYEKKEAEQTRREVGKNCGQKHNNSVWLPIIQFFFSSKLLSHQIRFSWKMLLLCVRVSLDYTRVQSQSIFCFVIYSSPRDPPPPTSNSIKDIMWIGSFLFQCFDLIITTSVSCHRNRRSIAPPTFAPRQPGTDPPCQCF